MTTSKRATAKASKKAKRVDDAKAKTKAKKKATPIDTSDKRAICEQYMPYVRSIAGKVKKTIAKEIEFDDLVEYGMIGLLEAADRYDPEHGANFMTFAYYRIRGAIYDEWELARYFKLADLLVLPGGVGLTCVHAFANDVPIVTTTKEVVDQGPEYVYVEHLYNGLILPSDDPALHAREIRDLLENPEALNRLAVGTRETARRLSMAKMVEGYEEAVLKAAAVRS